MTIKQKANRARIEKLLANFDKREPSPAQVRIAIQALEQAGLIKWSGYSTTRNSVQLVWGISRD